MGRITKGRVPRNIKKRRCLKGRSHSLCKCKGKRSYHMQICDCKRCLRLEIKVVRLMTGDMTQEAVFNQLLKENEVLRNSEVTPVCMFKITTTQLTYTNMIISTTLETHDAILANASLNFLNSKCLVYEIVNTLQCLKCLRFGHFSAGCSNSIMCRICAAEHDFKNCTNQANPPSCSNCILSNQSGTTFNIRHRATDDRCPVKAARINAIKSALVPKN